ncbi:MAG: hypothetical protein K1X36_14160 [Pyrinomonadaceae bacterium]|nr:hypothetical protein [Pyrinomonadaceae bacterium]
MYLSLVSLSIPVLAVSLYAFEPTASSTGIGVDPVAAPTPKKVKQVAGGDVNGDPENVPQHVVRTKTTKNFKPQSPESNGALQRSNTSPGRTETVNNNETLRSNRRTKNQDIEVENDETHFVGHDRKKAKPANSAAGRSSTPPKTRTETVDKNETITISGNVSEPDRSPEHPRVRKPATRKRSSAKPVQ